METAISGHKDLPSALDEHYQVISDAEGRVKEPDFDISQFVKSEMGSYEKTGERMEKGKISIKVGETLGVALHSVDFEDSQDEYETFKSALQALTPEQKHFCRNSLFLASDMVSYSLPADELRGRALADAQLISILS